MKKHTSNRYKFKIICKKTYKCIYMYNNASITMLSDYRYITFNRYYIYAYIYICLVNINVSSTCIIKVYFIVIRYMNK